MCLLVLSFWFNTLLIWFIRFTYIYIYICIYIYKDVYEAFEKYKINSMSVMCSKVTRGFLIINVLYLYYICFVLLGFFHIYYLFKPSDYIITIIIIIIMLINITFIGILEKSSGGEFQAKNLSGMI